MELWMVVRLQISNQKLSKHLVEFICSLASRAGNTRCKSQTGQPSWKSGPAVVRASRSVAPDRGKASRTKGTYGLRCEDSLTSAGLQSLLENKLRAKLARYGSPEYVLTWKSWDIGSQPQICAVRASVLRTSDKGFSGLPSILKGWLTPQALSFDQSHQPGKNRQQDATERIAGWPIIEYKIRFAN